jgi:hypothetical protein
MCPLPPWDAAFPGAFFLRGGRERVGRLTEEDAIGLVDYHLHRNHAARESQRKSWPRKHKRIKPEVLP